MSTSPHLCTYGNIIIIIRIFQPEALADISKQNISRLTLQAFSETGRPQHLQSQKLLYRPHSWIIQRTAETGLALNMLQKFVSIGNA